MVAVSLKQWLDDHYMTYSLRKDVLMIPGFGRCLIQGDYEHIFKQKQTKDGNTSVVFNPIENVGFLEADEIFYIVFPFGYRWYYVDIREPLDTVQFKELRYVGESPKTEIKCDYYPLGIHSGFELLNGSGQMSDWCKKAKFLGYKGIGIADRNTMAGTLSIQMSATDEKMKYVCGYSMTVRIGQDETVDVMVYSQTQEGFQNMLRIQKSIGVDNFGTKEIPMIELLNHGAGNVLVFNKFSGQWLVDAEKSGKLQDFLEAFDGWVYFQVDLSEYKADRIDSKVLLSTKAFFDHFYIGGLDYKCNVRPVLIQDVYYLDREDWMNKIVLNKIADGAAHEQSNCQYMKTLDELYDEFVGIFTDKYDDDVFYDMCEATCDIIENADTAYDLTENYAPRYIMTEEERAKYGTTHNMFLQLIEEGFKKLVPEGEEERYRERIEYEKYVIESTDNVDYCLITWDQLNWAQRNGILTGVGRGSAGGSLLLYVLGITYIDPLKYNLIFERFLLPERGGLLPEQVTSVCDDIDSSDYIMIELENGLVYYFDNDAKFLVSRDGEEIEVYADELLPDDDIKFDNKDLLWTLKERGYNGNMA